MNQIRSELETATAEQIQQGIQMNYLKSELENMHRNQNRQEVEISGLPYLKGTTPKQVFLSLAAKTSVAASENDGCVEKVAGTKKKLVISVKFNLVEKRLVYEKSESPQTHYIWFRYVGQLENFY